MSSDIHVPQDVLVLDACCAINLLASGYVRSIIPVLAGNVVLANHVLTVELHQSQTPPGVEPSLSWVELVKHGLVKVDDFASEAEEATFIELAAYVDDGEAASAALALGRGWQLASDDRKLIKLLQRRVPAVGILTTPHLMQHWVQRANIDRLILRSALLNIQQYARFSPADPHPLNSWWLAGVAP